MTKEQFQKFQREYEDNLATAAALIDEDPEAYTDEGSKLLDVFEQIQEHEERVKNLKVRLHRWKWRAYG